MFTVCGEDLFKFNGQNGTKFFDEKLWVYRVIGALQQGHHCSKGIYKGSQHTLKSELKLCNFVFDFLTKLSIVILNYTWL